MANYNTEFSLADTINVFKIERERIVERNTETPFKTVKKLDDLIKRAENLIDQNLGDKILLGSYVDLEIDDGDIDRISVFLGVDINGESITILSPLGYSIFGKRVGETVSYEVNTTHTRVPTIVTAKILGKNNYLVEENTDVKVYGKTTD